MNAANGKPKKNSANPIARLHLAFFIYGYPQSFSISINLIQKQAGQYKKPNSHNGLLR
jgi:hypothetical protein